MTKKDETADYRRILEVIVKILRNPECWPSVIRTYGNVPSGGKPRGRKDPNRRKLEVDLSLDTSNLLRMEAASRNHGISVTATNLLDEIFKKFRADPSARAKGLAQMRIQADAESRPTVTKELMVPESLHKGARVTCAEADVPMKTGVNVLMEMALSRCK